MDCQEAKKLMPIYLDKELEPQESQLVRDHVIGCLSCSDELEVYKKSWDMLDELEDIQPQQGFIGQFWTRLSMEQSWSQRIWQNMRDRFYKNRLIPALMTMSVVVIVGLAAINNYIQVRGTNQMLASLSEDDLAMVQNMELAENFDLIQDINFFEDLNILEELDVLES